MTRLIQDLIRPYWSWLVIVFLAMLVETAMNLAGPWPLKIVLDNAVGHHPLPEWLARMLGPEVAGHTMMLAAASPPSSARSTCAPGSFDSRRELAIEVHDGDVVERLHRIAKVDWKNSHPLDLSDEGLMADLDDREEGVAEKLALNADDKKKHKGKKK
jgi:hypothetical protein